MLYSDDIKYINAYIRDAESEIRAIKRRMDDAKNSFLQKHAEYIDGDIIRIKYPVKYKDIPDYMHEEIIGIVGVPTIEINQMTTDYDICYHGRKINKDGSIRRKAEYDRKVFHHWLIQDKVEVSFKHHVPRGKSLIQNIIHNSVHPDDKKVD